MNFNEEILKKEIVFVRPNDPFTWASGIKSPIYCDNRLILKYPKLRSFVANELKSLIEENFSQVDVIMGTSTAGIPHATLVADKMEIACGYVRSSSKKHGRQNKIEGAQIKGKNVVVVEDLISTGGSVLEVVNTLIDSGANVLGVVAIFSYDLDKAKKVFEEQNVKFVTISTINELLKYIESEKYLSIEEIKQVKDFLQSL